MPKNIRVLVADDDQAIRRLVSMIIRREGLEVDAAADGEEAIQFLEQNEYSVILLDLMMPRLDGFGVVDYLLQHPPARKPVVLVVTAYADQQFKEVDASIVAGVLRKPFEVADIGSIVRLCVNGYDEVAQRQLSQSRDSSIRDLALQRFDDNPGGSGTTKGN